MRILGSAVLVMEALVMGFAVLIAKDHHGSSAIIAGLVLALLFLLTPGILKKKSGWILGSLLQILIIAYALIVPSMIFIGLINAGLWIAAIVVGRKGEAARAALLAQAENPGGVGHP